MIKAAESAAAAAAAGNPRPSKPALASTLSKEVGSSVRPPSFFLRLRREVAEPSKHPGQLWSQWANPRFLAEPIDRRQNLAIGCDEF